MWAQAEIDFLTRRLSNSTPDHIAGINSVPQSPQRRSRPVFTAIAWGKPPRKRNLR